MVLICKTTICWFIFAAILVYFISDMNLLHQVHCRWCLETNAESSSTIDIKVGMYSIVPQFFYLWLSLICIYSILVIILPLNFVCFTIVHCNPSQLWSRIIQSKSCTKMRCTFNSLILMFQKFSFYLFIIYFGFLANVEIRK